MGIIVDERMERMVENEKKLRLVQVEMILRMIFILQLGRMKDDERMERWCRGRTEKIRCGWGMESKAVNREDKPSRRYRDRDIAKFESSRRYRQR
jgi:hypothetical protein